MPYVSIPRRVRRGRSPGSSVKDIVELIRYGALPARRDSDGWAIAERDLRRFRAQWGNDVAAALEDAEEQEEDGGFITYVG